MAMWFCSKCGEAANGVAEEVAHTAVTHVCGKVAEPVVAAAVSKSSTAGVSSRLRSGPVKRRRN